MKRLLLFSTAALVAFAAGAASCITDGSTARPLAGTATAASAALDGALDAQGWTRGFAALDGALEAVSRTSADGTFSGRLDGRAHGFILILR